MRLLAPAKINLGLSIKKKLDNGYHLVNLVNCQVGLFDEIELTRGDGSELIYDDRNLIQQALKLMGKKFIVKLVKNIPIGSGLGGGSSDAAQVLKHFNRLDLAPKIGLDVAYAGLGGVKLEQQGISSKFTSLTDLPGCYFIVCVPNQQVKTNWAYGQIDKIKFKPAPLKLLVKAIANKDLAAIAENLSNDFSVLAKKVCPEINQIQKSLFDAGALGVSISGKGPAVFGIFANELAAVKAKKQLQKYYRQTYLVKPLKENDVYEK